MNEKRTPHLQCHKIQKCIRFVRHFAVAFQKIYDFNLTFSFLDCVRLVTFFYFLFQSSISFYLSLCIPVLDLLFCAVYFRFLVFVFGIDAVAATTATYIYDLRQYQREISIGKWKNIRIRHIVLSVIAVEPKININTNELCDCNQFYIAA